MKTLRPAASRAIEGSERPITARSGSVLWKSLLVLFKVRVVMLLLWAAVGGAFLSAGGWPGGGSLTVLLVAGGLAAAGASAINQVLERDLDARMERTRQRPLAARASARSNWILYAGVAMILLPTLGVLPFNPALAVFLLLGAVIYVGVYTMWLKPRTPVSIVIGGAAGSVAVLCGSASAGAWSERGAVLLALLVFAWTPTHFWSLAIAYRDDYARGGFPMLPVQIAPRVAARWVLLHACVVALVALQLGAHFAFRWLYIGPVGLAVTSLVALSIWLCVDQSRRRALGLFHASNLVLAVILLMICVNAVVW